MDNTNKPKDDMENIEKPDTQTPENAEVREDIQKIHADTKQNTNDVLNVIDVEEILKSAERVVGDRENTDAIWYKKGYEWTLLNVKTRKEMLKGNFVDVAEFSSKDGVGFVKKYGRLGTQRNLNDAHDGDYWYLVDETGKDVISRTAFEDVGKFENGKARVTEIAQFFGFLYNEEYYINAKGQKEREPIT